MIERDNPINDYIKFASINQRSKPTGGIDQDHYRNQIITVVNQIHLSANHRSRPRLSRSLTVSPVLQLTVASMTVSSTVRCQMDGEEIITTAMRSLRYPRRLLLCESTSRQNQQRKCVSILHVRDDPTCRIRPV